jgi:hypothetical protein
VGVRPKRLTQTTRPISIREVPTEQPHADHREHAKEGKHLDDDELQRRTEHERQLVERDRPQ